MAAKNRPRVNPQRAPSRQTQQRTYQQPANKKPAGTLGPTAQQGLDLLGASYIPKSGATTPLGLGMSAVMSYYNSLPPKQRAAALRDISNKVNNRDFSTWSNPFYSVLFSDLDPEAQKAYLMARGEYGGVAGPEEGGGEGGESIFTTGVHGKTGEFTKEKGKSKYKAGEAEDPGPTKGGGKKGPSKKRKAQTKKLVKRAVKKSEVKGKAIRTALRSEGVTQRDRRTYRRVAQTSGNRNLSSRLRLADRRNDRRK